LKQFFFSFAEGALPYQKDIFCRLLELAKLRPSVLRGAKILEIGGNTPQAIARTLYAMTEEKVIIINPALKAYDCEYYEIVPKKMEEYGGTPESFDLIYGCAVLEHMPDYEASLRHCVRLLRKGGHLLLNGSPHWFSPQGHHLYYTNKGREYRCSVPEKNPLPDFSHLYMDKEEMAAYLQKAGIPEEDISGIVAMVYDSTLISRVNPDSQGDFFRKLPFEAHVIKTWESPPADALRETIQRKCSFDGRFVVGCYLVGMRKM
jgi:SAM-dependent methyltransferase